MKKPVSIGIENYKELIDKSYYYVDKTLLIKDLLDLKEKAILFTRPRRFGKTLALSMMKTFFEDERDGQGEQMDNRHYFHGMKIEQAGEAYMQYAGQYPVISFSLKSAKQPDFNMAYESLKDEIIKEYERHAYILGKGILSEENEKRYHDVMRRLASPVLYAKALEFLSDCLKKYHNKNVIILIDEYDVPLENAYFSGFYEQMTQFIRSLFESALKTNDSLEFAVITGCLRISRESIFTGLNNLRISSVLNENYGEYFGFTESEVEAMLTFYDMEAKMNEVRQWYDGYLFGDAEVYNPWSVLNYVSDHARGGSSYPRPYWSNTSSNSIIRELIEKADMGIRREVEELVSGGTIEKPIHEEITYEDIHRTQDNLWNFLFFTGYLKAVSTRFEVDTLYLTMRIPNEEVKYIYRNSISEWFQQSVQSTDFSELFQALIKGEAATVESVIKQQLQKSISYHDNAEKFYHGFLLGLLSGMQNYEVISNRESGDGRPDIMLKPLDEKQPAVILELKRTDRFNQMEAMCDKALVQIEEQRYEEGLLDEGYGKIIKYGICFCKKSCMVKR